MTTPTGSLQMDNGPTIHVSEITIHTDGRPATSRQLAPEEVVKAYAASLYIPLSDNIHFWRKADQAGRNYNRAKQSGNRRRLRYWDLQLKYWSGRIVRMSPSAARLSAKELSY